MDERLILAVDEPRRRPGQEVTGVVRWRRDAAPRAGELRLRWDTAGKGDPEHEIVGVADLASLPRTRAPAAADGHPFRGQSGDDGAGPLTARDERRFRFHLPRTPYSFIGALIELTWSIEVELDGERAAVTLVVAPRGRPVEL